MKTILSCLAILMSVEGAGAQTTMMLLNFADAADREAWVAVNDGVMGGLSEGGPAFHDGRLHFSGRLSLENNGGFSSVRRNGEVDLAGFDGIRLRVKGDGRTYQLRMHTDSRYVGRPVSYSAEFETADEKWIEVDLPFASLRQSFRGRSLSGYLFDATRVQMVGLLLADKQPGPFSLEVEWIAAYKDRETEIIK